MGNISNIYIIYIYDICLHIYVLHENKDDRAHKQFFI